MKTRFGSSILTARRLAALMAIGICALAATAGTAAADPARVQASNTIVLRRYSVTTSFIYTTASGKVLAQPPASPAPGDRLELTDVDYKGNHAHHAKKWTVSDHTLCIFGSGGAGGATVVSGGTGRYAGATGTVASTDLGDTGNSDIVVTVHLAK